MEDINIKHTNLWLFVDRDKTEYMSNVKPHRTIEFIERINKTLRKRNGKSIYVEAVKRYNSQPSLSGWYNSITGSDYGTYDTGDDLDLDALELPRGFIKHHAGKDMTFDDDPIEYIY